jgi:hypothetical protein
VGGKLAKGRIAAGKFSLPLKRQGDKERGDKERGDKENLKPEFFFPLSCSWQVFLSFIETRRQGEGRQGEP